MKLPEELQFIANARMLQKTTAELTRATEQVLVLEDWHNFGASYAKTLLAWNANCEAAWEHLPAERYDERFRRMFGATTC